MHFFIGRAKEKLPTKAPEISGRGDRNPGAGIFHGSPHPLFDRILRIGHPPRSQEQERVIHSNSQYQEGHGRRNRVEGDAEEEANAKGASQT